MKRLNKITFAFAMAVAYVPLGALAHEQHASATSAQADMSEGEIKKIDKETGKVTIKHGELKQFGMPGMTMVFKAKSAALLENVKEGDKVHFVAEKVNGVLTVTSIEVAN